MNVVCEVYIFHIAVLSIVVSLTSSLEKSIVKSLVWKREIWIENYDCIYVYICRALHLGQVASGKQVKAQIMKLESPR